MLRAWPRSTTIAYILSRLQSNILQRLIKAHTFIQTHKAFKKYQKEYAHCLFMLCRAELLVPVDDGSYVNVPEVKIAREGSPNKALPVSFQLDIRAFS